jgi:hypothetical protein
MAFGFNLGGSFSKNKNSSYIDDKTSGAQWDNYNGAKGLMGSYSPTSQGQIQDYMNPYTAGVIEPSLQALDRSRQMAVNNIGDRAQAAHAFGGSRHGVAEGITNQGYAEQAGLLLANLYNQGYSQALGAAQEENHYGYEYPLARQGLLNSTLAGVTPIQYGKGTQWGVQGSVSGKWGQ